MTPILAQITQLREQLAQLDEDPASDHAATADAVAAWEEAVARGDIPTQRAMIKRAFPRLTLAPARSYGDHAPERFKWGRTADAAAASLSRLNWTAKAMIQNVH